MILYFIIDNHIVQYDKLFWLISIQIYFLSETLINFISLIIFLAILINV
jgi:hypothetical protein